MYDGETGKKIDEIGDAKQALMSLQFDKEKLMFITASKDGKARVSFDNLTLSCTIRNPSNS